MFNQLISMIELLPSKQSLY